MKRGYYLLVFILLALYLVFKSSGNFRGPRLSMKKQGSDEWASLNFEFCSMLSNAKFDRDTYINAFGGSINEVKPPTYTFIKLIDTAAKNYHDYLNAKDKELDYESSKRYACYCAVSGIPIKSRGVSNDMLLRAVDPVTYFPFLSINYITEKSKKQKINDWTKVKILPDESSPLGVKIVEDGQLKTQNNALDFTRKRIDPSLKRYKIAYLIMVHENLDSLVSMMKALYSSEAIYLIHIDKNYPDFARQVRNWVENSNFEKNIFIMNRSFYGQWGGSSLVFIALEGFFQLMDLAEWDYVINLSASDYPIANTSTIHRMLEKTPQKSYILSANPDPQILSRLTSSVMVNRQKTAVKNDREIERKLPWSNRFSPKRTSQWMVISINSFKALSRSFVRLIRNIQPTYDLLAFMEFSYIPDESFFAMLASSPELDIADMIISREVRFLKFSGAHPITLVDGDEDKIFAKNDWNFFVRKVGTKNSAKLKKVLDDYRNNFPESYLS